MNKRDFVIQYVLNRALTQTGPGGLDGVGAARMAIKAWEAIENECPVKKSGPASKVKSDDIYIGDAVVVKDGHYEGSPPGSPYNLPRTVGIVVGGSTSDGFLKVQYGKIVSPPVSPDSFIRYHDEKQIRTTCREE